MPDAMIWTQVSSGLQMMTALLKCIATWMQKVQTVALAGSVHTLQTCKKSVSNANAMLVALPILNATISSRT
jgi:hypothetical protein